MFIRNTLLIACLASLPLSAMAQTVSVETGRGGSMTKDRDCLRGNGQASCQTTTSVTTPNGQTAGKTRTRTSDGSGTQTTVTGTGPNGETRSSTRKISVSR